IESILEVVPAAELTVQFDLAWEVVDLSMGLAPVFPWGPRQTVEEKFSRHTASLRPLAKSVPEKVALGFHWCYGTWGGWPMSEMPDLALCVDLSNEAARCAGREVDYFHMPVVRVPDAAFFAPLEALRVGRSRV